MEGWARKIQIRDRGVTRAIFIENGNNVIGGAEGKVELVVKPICFVRLQKSSKFLSSSSESPESVSAAISVRCLTGCRGSEGFMMVLRIGMLKMDWTGKLSMKLLMFEYHQ